MDEEISNLHEAVYHRVATYSLDSIESYLKSGANPNAVDGSGRRPLTMCVCPAEEEKFASSNRLEKANLLLKYGADVNATDQRGWTVAHDCAWLGDLGLLKLIVRYGADLTCKNKDKQTAAELAFVKGHKDICSFLDIHSLPLHVKCRSAVRKALGKRVNSVLHDLPLPALVKLFINYNNPYPNWECTPIPEEPWSMEDLTSGSVKASDLSKFIEENASEEFLAKYKIVEIKNEPDQRDFQHLVATYQQLYITESFKKVVYTEPLARKTRLGEKRYGVIGMSEFEAGAMDFLLREMSEVTV